MADTNRRSLAERRASKKRGRNVCFDTPKINTARFRTTSPLPSPTARSPCLTIPPGISPTVLLDSPIMLLNTQDLPSPTTGTFPILATKDECSLLNSVMPKDGSSHGNGDSFFRFKTQETHNSLQSVLKLENQEADIDYQALESEKTLVDFGFPATDFSEEASTLDHDIASSTDVNIFDTMKINGDSTDNMQICLSEMSINQPSVLEESAKREGVETQLPPLEGEQKGSNLPLGTSGTSEDGYNWRKYGQKQVKGSEYPRSYYKCTHPNCQVKKKVERSLDGQITEIIYKGAHNHPKPDPNRRPTQTLDIDQTCDIGEGCGNRSKVEGGVGWRNAQYGLKDNMKLISDWSVDGVERTSSASVVTELSDPLSNTQGKAVGVFEGVGTPELSSTLASRDDDDGGGDDGDHITQGSISIDDQVDDGELESKRRREEGCLIETNLASRGVREPRVVVQIESEVDILEDGYRWRKYGQKVVKGNPNPRSYYKCTSAGCSVRKHVERASHNLKCVITTYEGRHNHDVPAARNGSQVSSSNGSSAQPSASTALSTMASTINSSAPKPESQIQDLATHFDRKPGFNYEYQRPIFGAPSICQMKFPPLQNSLPYSTFALNSNQSATSLAGSMASMVPDFPISLPFNQNLSAAGFDFTNGRSMQPFQVFLAGQHLRESDRFLTPKQEHNDDNLYGPFQPIVDSTNVSLSSSVSSVYQQIIGNFQ